MSTYRDKVSTVFKVIEIEILKRFANPSLMSIILSSEYRKAFNRHLIGPLLKRFRGGLQPQHNMMDAVSNNGMNNRNLLGANADESRWVTSVAAQFQQPNEEAQTDAQ